MRKIAILLICVMALFAVNSVFAAEQPQMSVSVSDINAGETAHVSIFLPSDASGVVTVSVNGQTFQTNVVDGQAGVDLVGLAAGSYTVNVQYGGSGNYSSVSKQASLKVAGAAPEPSAKNNTHANASGEPTNVTPISNTNVTGNATNNSTNTTNTTNNTTPNKAPEKKAPVKKPKKEMPKPHKYLNDKKTGLPIMLLFLVVIGVVFGVAFRKR